MTNTPIFNCITDTNGKTWHLSHCMGIWGRTGEDFFLPSPCQLYIPSDWGLLIIFGNFMATEDSSVQLFIYPGLQEFIFNRTLKNAVNTKYANCINKRIPTAILLFFFSKHTLGPSPSIGVSWWAALTFVDACQIYNSWGSFPVKQNAYKNVNKRVYLDICIFFP